MVLKAETPIYHIEGVPLVPIGSLAFVLEYSFIQGLSWYHETVGERRPEFPLWSWTGWTVQLVDKVILNPRWSRGPYDLSIRIEYENEIIRDFPKQNEWQDFLSKIANIRVKFLHIKGQTLKCTILRTANEVGVAYLRHDEEYLLKFQIEKNTAFYAPLRLDLDGSQNKRKPLECICLSRYERFPAMLLIATNTDGVKERVGCMDTYHIYYMQDGMRFYRDPEVYLAMLKKKLQLQTIRLG